VVFRDEDEGESPIYAQVPPQSPIDLAPYFLRYGGLGHKRSCKAYLSQGVRKQLLKELIHSHGSKGSGVV
jgi:hypothetical protein